MSCRSNCARLSFTILGVATFLTSTSFAADLLIGTSGERRAGVLNSCNAEHCYVDKAPSPVADLIWIGFGVAEQAIPGGTTELGAVLADGTVVAGRLVGISQGTVLLDSAELERAAVRWVRVTAGMPPADVFIRRDGTLLLGSLLGCSGGSCTMATGAATRADLAWIGLAVDQEAVALPAPPEDPARDMVQFADGSRRFTPLIGVSASDVVLGTGSVPRSAVAWIYLAPPTRDPGPPTVYQPSPPSQPSPGPLPQPQQPPAPGEPPPSPGADLCNPRLGGEPGSGVTWSGTVRMRQWMRGPGWHHQDTADFTVKLRESCEMPVLDLSATPPRQIGTMLAFDAGGTVQRDTRREESTGYCICEGEHTITEPAGSGGAIYRRTGVGDSTAVLGFDLPAQPFYSLAISNTGEVLKAPCRGETCSGERGRSLMRFSAGLFPLSVSGASWDSEMRRPEGGVLRGFYTKALGPATLAVAWSICRAGVQCPPLPGPSGGTPPEVPLPPDTDPCGDLPRERALVDVTWDQRQSYTADLKREWDQLAQTHADMLHDVEAYYLAIDLCAITDILSEVLEGWTMKGDRGGENWGANFVEFGVKLLNGDISASVGKEPWKSLSERATDAFPDHPDWASNMRQRVTGCGTVTQNLRTAALRFVDNWERQRALMPRVQEKVNRIRDLDLRYWEGWNTFYSRCLGWAACKGVPTSTCPRPPEQPSGPMPPPAE